MSERGRLLQSSSQEVVISNGFNVTIKLFFFIEALGIITFRARAAFDTFSLIKRPMARDQKLLMRAVVRRVHPDLFTAHPRERLQNSEGLKVSIVCTKGHKFSTK